MNIRVAARQKVTKFLTFYWPLNSFHRPFINEKHVYIHFSFFLQAIDSFLFIFNLFPLFTERGRCLKESIYNENHWPQLLHVSNVECQIDRFACFAAHFSSFPKENALLNLEENL